MKKLFMFLAVAGLATFGTSCGSDDNKGGDDPAKKSLVLEADKTSVEKGASVNFTVKVEGKVEAGAELYMEGTKISSPAKFDKVGKFKVVAKKNGFVDSKAVEITVTEAGTGEPEPGVETLVLTGNPAAGEVGVGTNLSFFFTDAAGVQVTGAKLFKNGTEINGSEYVVAAADAETTLKFTAKKGDLVSNEIVYTVGAETVIPENNFLQVGDEVVELKGAAFFRWMKDEAIAKVELTDGRIVSVFEIRTFTNLVRETIEVEYYDDLTSVLEIWVVQPQGTPADQVVYPWTEGAEVLIGGLDIIKDRKYVDKAAQGTQFSFGIQAPNEDGIGNVAYAVEGTTEEGEVLNIDYGLDYQAFYNYNMPSAKGVKFNLENRTLKSSIGKVSKVRK